MMNIEGAMLLHGDCLELLRTLPDCSVDAVVTDPPYGLKLMGKKWDCSVPGVEVWAECLRVLKPGGHLLAFAGTRTQHRMAVNIEDAGFEIRDMIAWVYGSGFPKSADVSKMMDKHEEKQWLDVCKALDNADCPAIIEAWKEYLKTASNAGLSFQKSETATGMNTPKSGSAPASVLLQANPKSSDAIALVAELSLIEAHRTGEGSCNSVQSLAESSITELRSHAINAASQHASLEATLVMPDSSALWSAWGCQGESAKGKLKAVEALKTWLGSKPSLRRESTVALCAALIADLKLIMLSQSKTFQNFDTTRQTDCVSAISVTITESTAASLILFTVDTLRSKAMDKAAGAERDVVGVAGKSGSKRNSMAGDFAGGEYMTTAPATEAAKQWLGWGTALKPALEPITVARKPLAGTVAANVLEHGTGALNIDGCRVGGEPSPSIAMRASGRVPSSCKPGEYGDTIQNRITPERWQEQRPGEQLGRWPANLIHDGSDEVADLLGSAARFFYCPKASKADRNEGCEGLEAWTAGKCTERTEGSDGLNSPRAGAGRTSGSRNFHPTVKPTALMRYLCRLVTPPGGVVLDPFMGSGSTGKAALLDGFRFVGIEREAEYMRIAEQRISSRTRCIQRRLF